MFKFIFYMFFIVNVIIIVQQLEAPRALDRSDAIKVYRSNSGLLSYDPDPRKLNTYSLQEYAARAIARYGDQCNNNRAQLTKNLMPLILQELIMTYERERQSRVRVDNNIKLRLGL